MADRVTLVLEKNRVHRIKVSGEDLVSKSEYFSSLLSANFKDSTSLEHRINYDIDVDTLRTFVKWVSDPVASVIGDRRHVKPSLAKYVKKSGDFDDLLQLLELSVLFASPPLIADLTDLIACHYLIPQRSVQIWLLAKELGLTTLMRLAKAACIDRLPELPIPSLVNLSGEDFIELAGNVHINMEYEDLLDLVEQWTKQNVPLGEANAFGSRYPFTLIGKDPESFTSDLEEIYENQQYNHNIQCIVGHKQTLDDGFEKCVYSWDGVTFSEVIELSSCPIPSVENIVGIKALGHRFDIYLIGGGYGRRSGNLQPEIWRYSMISKTWYYVTSMPRPRSHMAVIFVNEDLYLIGGPEYTRGRCSLVDVYNVHTGKWRKLRYIHEIFSDTALIVKVDDSVTLFNYYEVYWHLPDENRWAGRGGFFHSIDNDGRWALLNPVHLMSHGDFLYVLGSTDKNRETRKIFWLESFKHLPSNFIGDFLATFFIGDCLTTFDNQVSNGPILTGFSHKGGKMCIEVMRIYSNESLETKIVYEEDRSDIKDLCVKEPIGCFNVINPERLNELFVLEYEAE